MNGTDCTVRYRPRRTVPTSIPTAATDLRGRNGVQDRGENNRINYTYFLAVSTSQEAVLIKITATEKDNVKSKVKMYSNKKKYKQITLMNYCKDCVPNSLRLDSNRPDKVI